MSIRVNPIRLLKVSAILVIALMCAVAFAATRTSADSSGVAEPTTDPVPGFTYPPAASPADAAAGQAAVAQRFALFRAEQTVVLASMVIQDPGIDRTAGRELTVASAAVLARSNATTPEARIWVAPRYDGTVCLLPLMRDAQGPAEACATADEADSGHLVMTQSRSSSDVDVYGLVPDGVDGVVVQLADGSKHALPVLDNAYAAHFAQPTESVAFEDASGAMDELTLRSDG